MNLEDSEQMHHGTQTDNETADTVRRQETLYIGIDPGTYTTAISTNTGIRFVEYSVLAYKDEGFRQNADEGNIIFGKAALEQTEFEVKEPIKELLFGNTDDTEPVRLFLQHCFRCAGIELGTSDSYAIIGVPAGADMSYKKAVMKMAGSMFTGAMMADEAFCVAYGSGRMENSLIVDMGASKLDICHINGNVPAGEDHMSISFAGDNIDRELIDLICEKYEDATITRRQARQWKENFAFVGSSDLVCEVELPLKDTSEKATITEELRFACESVIPDVVSGLTRMISDMEPHVREALRNNIYVCGGCSKIKNVGSFIESELKELGGGKIYMSDDPDLEVAEGARKLTERMPEQFWAQLND